MSKYEIELRQWSDLFRYKKVLATVLSVEVMWKGLLTNECKQIKLGLS
jgi:hypothetical protein